RQFDNSDLARLGPARGRCFAVARIDCDGNRPWMIGGCPAHELGVAQGRGAEHDAVDAEFEPMFDRRPVSDPAAELDAQVDGSADRDHRGTVHRTAGEGAVEVDEMQPEKAQRGKMPSPRPRIVVEYGGASHVPPDEANAAAVL